MNLLRYFIDDRKSFPENRWTTRQFAKMEHSFDRNADLFLVFYPCKN